MFATCRHSRYESETGRYVRNGLLRVDDESAQVGHASARVEYVLATGDSALAGERKPSDCTGIASEHSASDRVSGTWHSSTCATRRDAGGMAGNDRRSLRNTSPTTGNTWRIARNRW